MNLAQKQDLARRLAYAMTLSDVRLQRKRTSVDPLPGDSQHQRPSERRQGQAYYGSGRIIRSHPAFLLVYTRHFAEQNRASLRLGVKTSPQWAQVRSVFGLARLGRLLRAHWLAFALLCLSRQLAEQNRYDPDFRKKYSPHSRQLDLGDVYPHEYTL